MSRRSRKAKEIRAKEGGAPIQRSRRREWLFRLIALTVVPVVLLGGLEGVLRLVGYGFPTGFFKKVRVGDKVYLEENDRFGLRFFPPELARTPGPIFVNEARPPGTFRIFILGESAAMGDPEPAFGAGRYLQVLLDERFPGTRFEIINTGITAINSHVILPIARDCASQQGDLWIIYMGNNEMVGPYGAATVFGAQAPPLGLVRLKLAAQRTRVGQLAMNLAGKIRGKKSALPPSWAGMQMFTENRLMPDDPRKETVYQNFKQNLQDILKCGAGSGTKILLSTVAVNLKDCPPFASLGGSNLSEADQTLFDKYCAAGAQAVHDRNFATAARNYEEAARISPKSADVQFQWADCLLRQSNAAAAYAPFQKACDDDALPFRADSRINGIITETGRRFAGRGVVVLDANHALETNAPVGILGNETFYEHVHFNFDGNYRLARVWADQIEGLLPSLIRARARSGWATQDECERLLGLTDWNRCNVIGGIVRRMAQAPLSSQANNEYRVDQLKGQVDKMRREMNKETAAKARAVYTNALQRAPGDNFLHENYADFLVAEGDYPAAIAEWRKVHELLPDDYLAHFRIGGLLAGQNQLAEAEASLSRALALRADLSDAWFELGEIHASQNKLALALQEYRRAQQLRPQDAGYFYYSGKALSQLNRGPEALEDFHRAVKLKPDFWEARYSLGGQLGLLNQISEARQEFQEVIRLNPDYAPAHLNLGVAWMRQGQLDDAILEFEETLRLVPGDKTATDYLGQAQKLKRQQR